MNEVHISVRALVEYVFRAGSIDSRFRTSATMTEGTKAHQAIQKTYKEMDQKEVLVKTVIEHNNLSFLIEGRYDGLILSEEQIYIDEIKSTSGDISLIAEETHPVHWAQAKCYAFMIAKEGELDEIGVQLTYVSVQSGEQKRFRKSISVKDLQLFMDELVRAYTPYAELRTKHQKQRNNSIAELSFPFETYREGQRNLAGTVYKVITDKADLFAQHQLELEKRYRRLFQH